MKKYKVEIEGIRPLLTNKKLEDEEAVRKRGEEQDSEELAKKKVYKVGNKLVIPAEQIERAMEKVASSFKLEGQGKKTYKDLVQGAVFVEPEFIEITPQGFEIDRRSVVIPSTKGRITRYRPKWKSGWKLKFEVRVMDDRVKPEVLQKIIDEAGRIKGIGDGRSIGMGRFMLISFQLVK